MHVIPIRPADNEIKVGQTWLSDSGNLWRVVNIEPPVVNCRRVGFLDDKDQEHRCESENEMPFTIELVQAKCRIVSRNPFKFDTYLRTMPGEHCPSEELI